MALTSVSNNEVLHLSRVRNIHCSIASVSAQIPDAVAANILHVDRQSYWSTASRTTTQTIILELCEAALLFALKIDNRSTRSLEVAVAACNKPSAYVTVQEACEIPQNKCMVWRTGFLPSRFVRITCLTGNPISIYSVQAIGLPLSRIYSDFDPEFWHLMVENTVNDLFNPVLPPASRIGHYDAHARMRGDVRFTACRRIQTATASAQALTALLNEPKDDYQKWQSKRHAKHKTDALNTSTLSDFARDYDDEVDESVTEFLSKNPSASRLPENVSAQVAHFVSEADTSAHSARHSARSDSLIARSSRSNSVSTMVSSGSETASHHNEFAHQLRSHSRQTDQLRQQRQHEVIAHEFAINERIRRVVEGSKRAAMNPRDSALQSMKLLTCLDLSFNSIGDVGFRALAPALSSLSSLVQLDMLGN